MMIKYVLPFFSILVLVWALLNAWLSDNYLADISTYAAAGVVLLLVIIVQLAAIYGRLEKEGD